MNIFGLGTTELIIILVVVLILFGPKRLPQLGKSLGKTMRAIRDGADGKAVDEEEDDQVDELYNRIYHNLVTATIADPKYIDHANYLLWVAHNLERTADRVTNICERTVFIATGELMEITDEDEEELAEE
jgi:TatA/E family protein of Tat protein translocase